jgi:quercetin dioxygenase-like cupin family protein
MQRRTTILSALLAGAITLAHGAESRVVESDALPPLDGARLQVQVVEVTYRPGERSAVHSHPCAVSGYVIEGAVRMQTQGGPEAVYTAGQSFYEAPNSVHLVSANASATERARFVAYFVCDHPGPLTVPANGGN